MTYEYPNVAPLGYRHSIELGFSISFWVLTAGMIVGAVLYFRRSLQGKPRSGGILVGWLSALIFEFGLLVMVNTAPQVTMDYVAFTLTGFFAAGGCALITMIHCFTAVATDNLRVRLQAIRVLQISAVAGAFGTFVFMCMVPSVRRSREAARRSQCKNNLKQIGLAFYNWADTYERFVDASVVEGDHPPYSWRVALLPYVDQGPLRTAYHTDQPWDSPDNRELAKKQVPTYECPSLPFDLARNKLQQVYSAFATVTGPNTAFPNGKGLKLNQFHDGLSNTVLVAEACGQQIIWSKPQDIEMTSENVGINLPSTQPDTSYGTFSSYHSGGAHTLLADGSVRFISKQIDPRTLKGLLTATGNETLGDF